MKELIKTLPELDVDLAMATGNEDNLILNVEAWNSEIAQGFFNPYTYWSLREYLEIPQSTLDIILNDILPGYIGEALTEIKKAKGVPHLIKNLICLKELADKIIPEMGVFLEGIILEEKNFFQLVAWYGQNYEKEMLVTVDKRESLNDQIRREMERENIPFHFDFLIAGA